MEANTNNNMTIGQTVKFGESIGMIAGREHDGKVLVELLNAGTREIEVSKLTISAAKLKRTYGKQAGGTLVWK